MSLETPYKRKLQKKVSALFPGCVILKNNEQFLQGIPDMLILYGGSWAMLEVKASRNAEKQPNQQYWVDHFDSMSFAAFIYPENEQDVLRDLQHAFESQRAARLSQR